MKKMTEKEFDFVAKCKEAFETAKARGQDDALQHCAGEIVEACNARAAFLQNHSEQNRKWLYDELADIAICVLSDLGENLLNEDCPFNNNDIEKCLRDWRRNCCLEDEINSDNLKFCAEKLVELNRDAYLIPSIGVFTYAEREFYTHFFDGDFLQAIADKMAVNKKRGEK